MKIDVDCEWDDDDMKSFPHLTNKNFTILVDKDYIDDEDELISAVADEVYRDYQVVLPNSESVRHIVKDWEGLEESVFND